MAGFLTADQLEQYNKRNPSMRVMSFSGDSEGGIADVVGRRRPIYFVHKNNGRWVPEKSSLLMDVLELRDGTMVDEFPH